MRINVIEKHGMRTVVLTASLAACCLTALGCQKTVGEKPMAPSNVVAAPPRALVEQSFAKAGRTATAPNMKATATANSPAPKPGGSR